ncbi:MAG: hypothetical protein K8E66_00345 [Phycisphaerales bacterium]|nr:hypothetical protein [Phycisphaerales bacterium]
MVCTAKRVRTLPGLGAESSSSIHLIDPWRVSCGAFLSSLNEFLSRTRVAGSLGVPAWALYDCAESTGAVIGFTHGAHHPGEPISMVAVTPMMRDGAWHFYALCAREPCLIPTTLELAVGVVQPREFTTVLAYTDGLFDACLSLGRIELVTAWTPAHTDPASATIRVFPGNAAASGGHHLDVNARSSDEMVRVQHDIENGARFAVEAAGENGVLNLRRVGD